MKLHFLPAIVCLGLATCGPSPEEREKVNIEGRYSIQIRNFKNTCEHPSVPGEGEYDGYIAFSGKVADLKYLDGGLLAFFGQRSPTRLSYEVPGDLNSSNPMIRTYVLERSSVYSGQWMGSLQIQLYIDNMEEPDVTCFSRVDIEIDRTGDLPDGLN